MAVEKLGKAVFRRSRLFPSRTAISGVPEDRSREFRAREAGWLFNHRKRDLSVAQYGRLYKVSLCRAESRKSEAVLRSQTASHFSRKHQFDRKGHRDFEDDVFIHLQAERYKGSQAALAQVSRPAVSHGLSIVPFNTDPDVLFEHISDRNPMVGAALIVQHLPVDSKSN